MPVTVFTAKVIGTVSIGLWAGYNVSFASQELHGAGLPARVAWLRAQLLASAAPADADSKDVAAEAAAEPFSAASALRNLASSVGASLLSGVVCIANLGAYALSSRAAKHPYLLYLALGAPLVGALQFFGARELWAQIAAAPAAPAAHDEASELSESTYEHVSVPGSPGAPEAPAAEDARAPGGVTLQRKYAIYTAAVAGLSTLLSTLSVIGLAGDNTARF